MPLYRHFSEFVVKRYLEYNGYFVRTNAIGLFEQNLLPEIDIVAVSICKQFSSECRTPEQGEFCPESSGNKQFLIGSVKFSARPITQRDIPTVEELENYCKHCDTSCQRRDHCVLRNLYRNDIIQWTNWAFGLNDESSITRSLFARTLNERAKDSLRQVNTYFKDFESIYREMYERLNTYTDKFSRETTDEFISLIGWLRGISRLR